ncbi:MBL fold metallo-hydrolase [Candidatus Wolfebacteria bacterium]|nr:MBL fold metallo-hydrolase [Candidatus Wolfebacteria bacterium]
MRVSYHREMIRAGIIFSLVLVQAMLLISILTPKNFAIAFLDVGQGDAIYIQAPNGNDMLIDGGSGESVLRALAGVMDISDREINVVVATHPDKDHIGGLIPVLDRYSVTHFLDPGVVNNTLVYKELSKRVVEQTQYTVARKGMRIHLGPDTVADVLFPNRDIEGDINNASVILRVSYKKSSILLTGDAGKGVERIILDEDIESDILKAGHHGSKTSSDIVFLRKVSPEHVILSVGAQNRYGHPHVNVLSALASIGTNILSTAEEGTIVFISDGESLVRK